MSSTEELPNIETPNYDLSKFKITRILNNNANRKTATVLGSFPYLSETEEAIIVLGKSPFTEKNLVNENEGETIFSSHSSLETEFTNNIYGSFNCFTSAKMNIINATIIYPATTKHIEKYSEHEKYIVQETPDLYENLTLQYIKSSQFSLNWVYNILEHKEEKDRIIFEDPNDETGFILLPDLKWDGKTVESLYVLALVRNRNIKSLRDLDETHLALLKNIRDAGSEAIESKYGLNRSQIRVYFHYQPSFYHLHVHFNALKHDAPGILCEKAHLLDTVINNIELLSDYYKKATIPFVLFDGNSLLEKYEEEKCIKKRLKTE